MNSVLTPVQLQNIQMRSAYTIFSKAILFLKNNNLLNNQDKEILSILFKNSTPQILSQPQIQFWSRTLLTSQITTKENSTIETAKEQLFFEIILILGVLGKITTCKYPITTSMTSPLLTKKIKKTNSKITLTNSSIQIDDTLEKIDFVPSYKNWFLGSCDYQTSNTYEVKNKKEIETLFSYYLYIPKQLRETIETLIHTIVILKKQSKNQISYSQIESPGMISIQYAQPILFCDSLLHESMHLEFELIKQVYQLVKNNTNEEKYYSSVIDKPRPLENCLLALHAFVPLEMYYFTIFKKTKSNLALSRLLSHYFKNEELRNTLKNHADFTQKGKELFEELESKHLITKRNIEKIQKCYKEEIKKYSLEAKKHKKIVLKKYPKTMC